MVRELSRRTSAQLTAIILLVAEVAVLLAAGALLVGLLGPGTSASAVLSAGVAFCTGTIVYRSIRPVRAFVGGRPAELDARGPAVMPAIGELFVGSTLSHLPWYASAFAASIALLHGHTVLVILLACALIVAGWMVGFAVVFATPRTVEDVSRPRLLLAGLIGYRAVRVAAAALVVVLWARGSEPASYGLLLIVTACIVRVAAIPYTSATRTRLKRSHPATAAAVARSRPPADGPAAG